MQLEIDKYCFRGYAPDSLLDPVQRHRYEDDLQMLIVRPPSEGSFQDFAPQVERDVIRVHYMRSGRHSKDRNFFEYLVNSCLPGSLKIN